MKKRAVQAPPAEKTGFPMRINKYLASRGFSTRLGGDALVKQGVVRINGKVANLGDKVEETDEVEVRVRGQKTKLFYWAYNKPAGVITHSPQRGERSISDVLKDIPEMRGMFPIGRLDKDSHGLIILTNDGRITDRLLNPDNEHTKEYIVKAQEKLRSSFKENMQTGVNIGDYVTKPCKVDLLGGATFRITLSEGKNRQIRRMVSALYNTVIDLKRVRVLNITLNKLPEGGFRAIKGEELSIFLRSLGLDSRKPPAHVGR